MNVLIKNYNESHLLNLIYMRDLIILKKNSLPRNIYTSQNVSFYDYICSLRLVKNLEAK